MLITYIYLNGETTDGNNENKKDDKKGFNVKTFFTILGILIILIIIIIVILMIRKKRKEKNNFEINGDTQVDKILSDEN